MSKCILPYYKLDYITSSRCFVRLNVIICVYGYVRNETAITFLLIVMFFNICLLCTFNVEIRE